MYLQLVSLHGLIRGENIEMGRDADTGGQVRYVVELARELATIEGVEQVDLFTRLIRDRRYAQDYGRAIEELGPKCRIVRLPCGGGKYYRKERLWPYLDEYIDRMIAFTRKEGRTPAWVHGHYVDAGYVARHVASAVGAPFIFSGHSLGRSKKAYLLERGRSEEFIEREYNMARRIREEEACLAEADLVITSTRYERDVIYGMYQHAGMPRYEVIPPGIDFSKLFPFYNYQLPGTEVEEVYKQARVRMTDELRRFYFQPDKPLILTVCRPERRKNLNMLVECYGQDKSLQAMANLAIFAGIRKDIEQMNPDEQEVLREMLFLMDKHDLYGKMAVPKEHSSETDVPELYRLAASGRGIFVSSAYVENFGLTFIESAATGLPWVGTHDGGPVDIAEKTRSGMLVDLSKPENLTEAMRQLLSDEKMWRDMSENGILKTREHYSWKHHCEAYLQMAGEAREAAAPPVADEQTAAGEMADRLAQIERLVICDIDDTLLGNEQAFRRCRDFVCANRERVGFGVATGRHIESAREILDETGWGDIDIFITSVGTEIYYGKNCEPDEGWRRHIAYKWDRQKLSETLKSFDFLKLQEDEKTQREFKISYDLEMPENLGLEQALGRVHEALTATGVAYNLIFSHGIYVDILPIRASKGKAIRYLSLKWGIEPGRILAAGNSGNDRDMLLGKVLGVVVGNHDAELEELRGLARVYFAEAGYADGILEGLKHYHFIRDPMVIASK